MALVLDTRLRAFDNNGDPLVGATLTIYTANTTTPAEIYRDAALTDPMTNPTSGADASDAGGWFPQIFTAEGGSFDITLKDSSGSTVKQWSDVPALGEESTTFVRDFTTSRVRIRDVGGVVYIEAGNASGDDTGGAMRLSGWGGTQLDELTFDAAEATFTGDATYPVADAAAIRTGTTTTEAITPGEAYNALAEVTFTNSSTTIITTGDAAIDMAKFINGYSVLGGNWTLPNPTNPKVGQTGRIRFQQDATGGRTLSYGANWKFPAGVTPVMPTAASAVAFLDYEVVTSTYIRAVMTSMA